MYRIRRKVSLNPTVTLMDIEAPLIAKKAEPGQFIILRVDEDGERIPLTIADFDREAGTVTIIFQIVGATTEKLNHKNEGECLTDFVGPLGVATHTDGLKKVAVVGGGVGCAIAYPIAKKLHHLGAEVHSIVGFRSKDLVILEDEFAAVSDKLCIMIDGTGMCGGCRLSVGGETKFACVDGPDFDGHLIDFDEAMSRSAMYKDFEKKAREETCNLFKGAK